MCYTSVASSSFPVAYTLPASLISVTFLASEAFEFASTSLVIELLASEDWKNWL